MCPICGIRGRSAQLSSAHVIHLPIPGIAGISIRTRSGRIVIEANSMTSRAEAVARGLGIALLLDGIVAPAHRLKPIWPDRADWYDIWLVVHSDIQRTARVRVIVDAVADAFRSARSRL